MRPTPRRDDVVVADARGLDSAADTRACELVADGTTRDPAG